MIMCVLLLYAVPRVHNRVKKLPFSPSHATCPFFLPIYYSVLDIVIYVYVYVYISLTGLVVSC
jgi:hypothetical protein